MTDCEFVSLIASLESGKADVVSGSMSITEERAKKVDFADTHYDSAMVLLVRDAGGAVQKKGFMAAKISHRLMGAVMIIPDRSVLSRPVLLRQYFYAFIRPKPFFL